MLMEGPGRQARGQLWRARLSGALEAQALACDRSAKQVRRIFTEIRSAEMWSASLRFGLSLRTLVPKPGSLEQTPQTNPERAAGEGVLKLPATLLEVKLLMDQDC